MGSHVEDVRHAESGRSRLSNALASNIRSYQVYVLRVDFDECQLLGT
jgi:hypothetical protein